MTTLHPDSHNKPPGDFPTLTAPGTTPVLTSIFQCSAEFLGQLKLWTEQNPPSVPITSILGFQQFTAQTATTISTFQTRTSSTFADLATVGPTLTGLPDGKYVLAYGAGAAGVLGVSQAQMAPQINATVAAVADAAYTSVGSSTSVMRIVTKSLTNGGNNTITMKYASSDNSSTCSWQDRWLIAIRYSNL